MKPGQDICQKVLVQQRLKKFSGINNLLTQRIGVGGRSHNLETWKFKAFKGLLGHDLNQPLLQMGIEAQREGITQRRFNST